MIYVEITWRPLTSLLPFQTSQHLSPTPSLREPLSLTVPSRPSKGHADASPTSSPEIDGLQAGKVGWTEQG